MANAPHRPRSTVARIPGKELDPPAGVPERADVDSSAARMALGSAYRSYLDSRKTLAQAFKDRELQDQESYKDAERRYHQCTEAVNMAVRNREKAEFDAAEVFRIETDRAIERSTQVYKDKARLVLADCKHKVMEAWKCSAEPGTETTVVCEEAVEKAMKAREKADMEALDAYRQEINQAIDRSSQHYRESIRQALAECRQRVLDAWNESMHNSAVVAGIFEQDRALMDPPMFVDRRDWTKQVRDRAATGYRSASAAVRNAARRLKVKLSHASGSRNDLAQDY
jgi:hypothetical protein